MLNELIRQSLQHEVAVRCGQQHKDRRPFISLDEHTKILQTLNGMDPSKLRGLIIIGVEELERDGEVGAEVHLGIAGEASLLNATLELVTHELDTQVEAREEDCSCRKCRRRRGELDDAGETPAVAGFEEFVANRLREQRGESPLEQLLRTRNPQRGLTDGQDLLGGLALLIALSRKGKSDGR